MTMDHIRKFIREQREEIRKADAAEREHHKKSIQELEEELKKQKDALETQIKNVQSKVHEITEIRLLNRRQGFSIFQSSSRNTGGTNVNDNANDDDCNGEEYEYAVLEDDVFSLMMTNGVSSKPWWLGMITFVLFQLGLGIAITYDQ